MVQEIVSNSVHVRMMMTEFYTIIAEHLSTRQLILHRISRSVVMYVCVTFRNAIHAVGGLPGARTLRTFVVHLVYHSGIWTRKTTKKEIGVLFYTRHTWMSSHQ